MLPFIICCSFNFFFSLFPLHPSYQIQTSFTSPPHSFLLAIDHEVISLVWRGQKRKRKREKRKKKGSKEQLGLSMDSHRNVKMAAELGAAQVGAIYLWIYLTSKCKNDLLFNSRSLCSRSRSLYHYHFLPPTLFFTIKPTEYYSLFDYLIYSTF